MPIASNPVGPDLEMLFSLFPPAADVPEYELVPADEVPEPYQGLLVHAHHMTVTVEAHHGDQVDVRILARAQTRDSYARKILLTLQGNGQVVQFGIMRVHLNYCSEPVRRQIVAGKTPLGRILIQHDVLRRIEPTAYLRVIPGKAMMDWFGLDRPRLTYGRLAYIHCNGQPAIELLEIVAPEKAAPGA
jgi:chorismate-pyruvate lyase